MKSKAGVSGSSPSFSALMCSMCAACSASVLYTQAQQTATEIRVVKRCERIESSLRTGWDADVETTCDGWHHHLL